MMISAELFCSQAFGLPIIHSLLMNWEQYENVHTPYALIIAPTRELAMQITTVLKDVCADFKKHFRIEVVTIVGGMSEQKQRRQLAGNKNPLHIVVATPGRLCEIFSDETVVAFQDMSQLRFLVVDEADRIMEEGHFAEVNNTHAIYFIVISLLRLSIHLFLFYVSVAPCVQPYLRP